MKESRFADLYRALLAELRFRVQYYLASHHGRHGYYRLDHINCCTWLHTGIAFQQHLLHVHRLGPDFSTFASEAFYKSNTFMLLPNTHAITLPPPSAFKYIQHVIIEVALVPAHWHQLRCLAKYKNLPAIRAISLNVRPILPTYDQSKPFFHGLLPCDIYQKLLRSYTSHFQDFLSASFEQKGLDVICLPVPGSLHFTDRICLTKTIRGHDPSGRHGHRYLPGTEACDYGARGNSNPLPPVTQQGYECRLAAVISFAPVAVRPVVTSGAPTSQSTKAADKNKLTSKTGP